MKKIDVVRVVITANEKYAVGLLMSACSCLAHASGKYPYEFIILDGGLSENTRQSVDRKLSEIAERGGLLFTLRFVQPDENLKAKLPERAGSWMTYARFLIPYLVEQGNAIYLDSDILCLRGVEEFYEIWDGSAAMVAARDPLVWLKKDYPRRENLPRSEEPYFNAGLILMNLNWFRKNLDVARVAEIVEEIGLDKLKYADQTIINMEARGSIQEVSQANNLVLATALAATVQDCWRDANLHYVGRLKPWQTPYAEPRRFLAETLYYWASVFYGIDGVAPRQVNQNALRSTQRKSFWYRFFKPTRATLYKKALESHKLGVDMDLVLKNHTFMRDSNSA